MDGLVDKVMITFEFEKMSQVHVINFGLVFVEIDFVINFGMFLGKLCQQVDEKQAPFPLLEHLVAIH